VNLMDEFDLAFSSPKKKRGVSPNTKRPPGGTNAWLLDAFPFVNGVLNRVCDGQLWKVCEAAGQMRDRTPAIMTQSKKVRAALADACRCFLIVFWCSCILILLFFHFLCSRL